MEWGWGVGKDMGLWRLKRGERFALSDGFERTGYIRKIEREGGFKEVLLSVSPTPQRRLAELPSFNSWWFKDWLKLCPTSHSPTPRSL